MKRIILSAFSCQPGKGSEPGVGWNWALQAATSCDVYVLTRLKMKKYIESAIPQELSQTLHFVYCDSSSALRKMTIYFEYINWQRRAYIMAKQLCKEIQFDYIWHITWGNMFLPTWLYKIDVPFIWGPVGGAEQVPKEFWNEFPLKNRIIHQCKYYMGKHMDKLPWVMKPAKKAAWIIARTNATKNLFPQVLQAKIKVHLEACVIQNRDFIFSPNTPAVLQKGEGLNLVYTGRICDIKNPKAFIIAMKEAAAQYPDCKLHIIGEGNMLKQLQVGVTAEHLDNWVKFYGNLARPELLKCVSQCDIFIFPSLKEGASWSLLEAMYFELPIVALDVNGIHDTLSTECAVLVNIEGMKPEEVNAAFAKKTVELMGMPKEQRKQMGSFGKTKIENYHSARGVELFIRDVLS